MLSAQTIALVKATVPALQQHGNAITTHFYQALFASHPEVKAFFNPAHQADGGQPRALADAVLAYAANIDRLEALAGAVPRIVHKHVALGVQPEQYPVVGECLLAAIRHVLGEAATPEILAAWGEAYQALADLLIAAEAQLYKTAEALPGGWRGERAFTVARKQPESEEITSFYLQPADGGALPAFLPGQYITLVLAIDGELMRRNYSLSDAPGQPWLRISVKREAGGRVSNWLHDQVQVGSTLSLQPPSGAFVLDADAAAPTRPLLLVTAGVGLTPAISMLESAAASGRQIRFIHAARHGGVHAFRERVDALAARHGNVQALYLYDEPRAHEAPHRAGRLTAELLAEQLPADRDVDLYFLGPQPFMQAVRRHSLALGVAADRLRHEHFGPHQAL